jgi:arylsulfatase A-like enzyme
MISQIDYNIGEFLKTLDDLKISKKTIVVFTSDHGEMMGQFGMWTKGRLGYDATTRIPMIIKNPFSKEKNKQSKQLIGLFDLYPTLCSLADLRYDNDIDGIDLSNHIVNNEIFNRKYLVTETGININNMCLSVRSTTHKYVQFRDNGSIVHQQFFDLISDPWEQFNLFQNSDKKYMVDEFKRHLNSWESSTNIHEALV